jgi:hypothetical protein
MSLFPMLPEVGPRDPVRLRPDDENKFIDGVKVLLGNRSRPTRALSATANYRHTAPLSLAS